MCTYRNFLRLTLWVAVLTLCWTGCGGPEVGPADQGAESEIEHRPPQPATTESPAAQEQRDLSQIDYAMYFMSADHDAPECEMTVKGGRIVIPHAITNPAMTCPDMFSWKLATAVILDEFWSRWADETQNWPSEPYPLCADGSTPPDCCALGSRKNDPEHCPSFPGDAMLRAADRTAPRPLRQSIRGHLFGPHESSVDRDALPRLLEAAPEPDAASRAGMRPCADLPLPDDPESIGRVIRQTNGELTLRNKPFHDFLFANNLYNADGVIEVFEKNARNIYTNAPYRRASHPVMGAGKRPDLSRITFPSDAIMMKTNWLNQDLMEAIGAKYGWRWRDSDQPYVQKQMTQVLKDQQGNSYDCSGVHNLLAFHISSKDIPNWVWATFEHVLLPGRCDYTGCNDSWGYFSSDADLPAGAARNYVRPKSKNDDLPMGADSQVFDRNRVYAVESIRPGLKKVFDDLGIGTSGRAGDEPAPADRAWRSYRLKGSQVEFVDSMGRPTFLGHSVTEAGFVNGSSCITCHARAGTDIDGPFHPGVQGRGVFPLSVFVNELSDYGYGRSAGGIPDKAWFHESNQPPALEVLQTDFVWGFLFARKTVSP